MMKYVTNSKDYKTIRIKYPQNLHNRCISCGSQVKLAYPDDGKIVRTLQGKIYQIINLYKCTNPDCALHNKAFNPAPRFDYCNRHFGADVFRFVAEELLMVDQKPDQILTRLNRKFNITISIDTIRRMCDDIICLKALKIDEQTLKIILKQGYILLGMDGQDPGGTGTSAIWCFTDMISNRILATFQFESLDYQILHETIEKIAKMYNVKIIGWVSDKQNVITACHDTYYPEIPHQYCQYHFLKNTWSHLTSFDSNVFLPLKKALNTLYINRASRTTTVKFENVGKVSVREVFKGTNSDLQSMIRVRNKRFKSLRGIWIYTELDRYTSVIEEKLKTLDPSYRFTKILMGTAEKLREALDQVKGTYLKTVQLWDKFHSIYNILYDSKIKDEKIRKEQLDKKYEDMFSELVENNPGLKLEDCKSFLANKNSDNGKIIGEWCRLWDSYKSGLFSFDEFNVKEKCKKDLKTNNGLENGFSREKQAIINRVAKGMVAHIVSTRGEEYLRIKHCTLEELEEDIIEQYEDEVVKQLRENLDIKIKRSTESWRPRSLLREKIDLDIHKYYVELENA